MKYNEFVYLPSVFAVGNEYQIIIKFRKEAMVKIKIGDKVYCDHSNGVFRSSYPVHKISVPMSELDKYGKYTVSVVTLINRLAYCSECYEEESETFNFYPVPKDEIKICHLADVHGDFKSCMGAVKKIKGDIDLLVLNGDVVDHSGNVRNFNIIYKLCQAITKGEKPVVFSRGNHDLRGIYAEKLEDYIPTQNRKTYYTFRLGSLWGLVLDTGEDKVDSHEEYGNTVCCEYFREDEEEFIKSVIENKEYEEEGITRKIVICHNPFTYCIEPPFDIERPRFRRWTKLIGENIKPDCLLSGHLHTSGISEVGGELDNEGIQTFPVVVGSERTGNRGNVTFGLAYITLNKDGFNVEFVRNK